MMTKPAIISPPAIILVRPQMGENIGAAARVMKNFGIADLRIVDPRDGWPNDKAEAMSAGGASIIENTHIYKDTSAAVASSDYVIAITARRRGMEKPHYTAPQLSEIYKPNRKISFMFGPERSGLENDDVVLANAIMSIPVDDEYPSLNLAQAVAVLAYQWRLLVDNKQETPPLQPIDGNEIASKEDVIRMLEHLEDELEKSNFFSVPDKKTKMVANIRNIFTRMDNLTAQEVRTLRGIIRSLTWPK